MCNESNLTKIFSFPIRIFGFSNILVIYFIINFIGLIIFSMFTADVLAKIFQPSIYVYANLYPWARPSIGPISKLSSLLQYVIPVIAIFIYILIYFYLNNLVNRSPISLYKNKIQKIGFYFLFAVLLNVVLITIKIEHKIILGMLSLLWAVMLIWVPYAVLRNHTIKISTPSWLLSSILLIISLQYLAIFVPLILNPFKIDNNYINIPEKTILNTGKIVDNISYINKYKIAGLNLYDPRNIVTTPNINLNPYQYKLDSINIVDKSLFSITLPPTTYSNEMQEFLKKNSRELLNQTKTGWFFYHHGYNFGPMNAVSLGASADKQTMVYGWLSTVTQSKILSYLGGVNYQSYFKVYFAEYILYFCIFILGLWAIFKRLSTVVFAAILSTSALYLLGIELIRLAPGFNPIRHIFDLPVFYLLYRYLLQDGKLYLILTCFLALFSILWSKDFGLFLTLSVGCTLIFKGIKQRPLYLTPIFVGLLTAISGVFLYFYPMPGSNPTAIYMLLGVGSPQIAGGVIFSLLLIVSILLFTTIAIKQIETFKILSVAMALYSVQSLTYFIWYPQFHHILGIAPVFVIWFAIIYNGWSNNSDDGNQKQYGLLILLFVVLYIPSSLYFNISQQEYNKIFKNHTLHNWSFDKARLVSTGEPTLFRESANLIKRYSPKQDGIFIISKYDHILPILANKYSLMPYNELPTNLASPKEVKISSDAILENKPPYIFVDTDINRDLKGEIPNEIDPVTIKLRLYGEARSRVMVLQGLNEVFNRVSDVYERCDSGKLISVYCRKSDYPN